MTQADESADHVTQYLGKRDDIDILCYFSVKHLELTRLPAQSRLGKEIGVNRLLIS